MEKPMIPNKKRLCLPALALVCALLTSCGATAMGPAPSSTPEAARTAAPTPSPSPSPSPTPTPTPAPTPTPSPTPIPKPTPAPAFAEDFSLDKNPEHVWEPFPGSVDIMIFSSHPDDDQLFMGAVTPTYAQQGKSVVTVFMTCGYNETTRKTRMQEALNGVYTVGGRIYPVFGSFTDSRTNTLAEGRRLWKPEDKLLAFMVEQIRKYKPAVIVTHDIYRGEYKNGSHMYTAEAAQKVFAMSADANCCPESAEKYGTWQAAKLYLHLYKEHPLVIDTKAPLDMFGGKTAFDMAEAGYSCHKSQLHWGFAVSRTKYSIEQFGLVLSMVGYGNTTNDMFENIGKDTMYLLNNP
jgi:LmbE family N-acetylglucosaminyl deacetylase